jgi:hypothetical protein
MRYLSLRAFFLLFFLTSGFSLAPLKDLHGANPILVVFSVAKVYHQPIEKKSLVRASATTIGYLV